MPFIQRSLDTHTKLSILSDDAKYDLACSCGMSENDRRHRSPYGTWVYPVSLPNGGYTTLFKTLLSNACVNDCAYCPLRRETNIRRCSLHPHEVARTFMEYHRKRVVMGLFLSSGIIGDADTTMASINTTAALIRRQGFRGYMHLKIVPGASDAAIQETLSLASAVSLNIETAGEKHFRTLCSTKKYVTDIIQPIKVISKLTAKGMPYSHVKHTTQFVVGAAQETDREIVEYVWGLYTRLGLQRIYFSGYQNNAGVAPHLLNEQPPRRNNEILVREHRLYQVDWLIRKYKFSQQEIVFTPDGNLPLDMDPKEYWAQHHPELFPVDINHADKMQLLRVPGLGEISVARIMETRKQYGAIHSVDTLKALGVRIHTAHRYIQMG